MEIPKVSIVGRPRINSAYTQLPKKFNFNQNKLQEYLITQEKKNREFMQLIKDANSAPLNIIKENTILNQTQNSNKLKQNPRLKLKPITPTERKPDLLLSNNPSQENKTCYGCPVLWWKKSRTDSNVPTIKSPKWSNQWTDYKLVQYGHKRIDSTTKTKENSKNEIEELSRSESLSDWNGDKNGNNLKKQNTWFQTLSKELNIDPFLHNTYQGKAIKWNAVEIIYEGTTAVIYKAIDLNNGGFIAVKRYLNRQHLDTFDNEIKILTLLKNTNSHIIQLLGYDRDTVSNNYFIYLQHVPNGNLKQLISSLNNKLPTILIKKYLKQWCNTVRTLHEKHIVHRDIKCNNIWLDSKGDIIWSDFGTASANASKSIDDNEFCVGLNGTLPWCSPEILWQKKYGVKCDIWAIGCTIIELLGENPWGNKIDNYYQCINLVGKGEDVPEIPENCCADLKSFIMKCLKRKVSERKNIWELVNDEFLQD